jgi:hypothetical protein
LLGCDGEGVESFGGGFGAGFFEVFGVGFGFVAAAAPSGGGEEGAAVGLAAWHCFSFLSLLSSWGK